MGSEMCIRDSSYIRPFIMAQYSDLPAEVRLSIMENLIDDADHRALHSLLLSSPPDLRLFGQFKVTLLRRLANIMLDTHCGENKATRQLILTAAIMVAGGA